MLDWLLNLWFPSPAEALLRAMGQRRSPRWPAKRDEHLKREPRCLACGSREYLNVHHEWPVSWPGGKDRELEEGNLMTLCESPGRNCHLWIGHSGDFRARNTAARADARTWRQRMLDRSYPEDET